jgi:hypothetical protein
MEWRYLYREEHSEPMSSKPKYRAEKHGKKWYAMRGAEIASEPYKTKREAETASIRVFASDWHYINLCHRLGQPEPNA